MGIRVPGDSVPKRLAAAAFDLIGPFVNRGELLPPFSMRRFIGEARWQLRAEDFKLQGNQFVEKLVADAGLTPSSQILDLGSGCGRVAIPLTKILDSGGSYSGLDPVRPLVNWCTNAIATRFPNFKFELADVRNTLYNPHGRFLAEEFAFPFPDRQFDIVVAMSVFTHLKSRAIERYASECARVLKPGGRLFASFFLLDNGPASPDGRINFAYSVKDDPCSMTVDPQLPERAVAHRSEWLTSLFSSYGLKLKPPVRWGSWTGYKPPYSGQDVVIVEKQANPLRPLTKLFALPAVLTRLPPFAWKVAVRVRK